MDGFGISREGNRGIARWRHRDLISKKGVKGFGWILEIWEIKGVSDWFGLLRLSQTILENILCNQGMISLVHQRKGLKGVSTLRILIQLYRNFVFQIDVVTGFFGLIRRITRKSFQYLQYRMIEDTIFGLQCFFICVRSQGEKEYYKRGREARLHIITLQQSNLFSLIFLLVEFFVIVINMTQGQLLVKAGNKNGGEAARKPLRITMPHFDNSALIQNYDKTLIGKCMNPQEQDVTALIIMLPKIWKVEDRVAGADLGLGRFQFDFNNEEDIEEVLKMQPYHFYYWMISLVRWKPVMEKSYPTEITFWVRVLGVPLQYWAEPTFESIGGALGNVVEVDLEYGRVKVVVDGAQCLCFETSVDFCGGEFYGGGEELIALRYEKLFGYCSMCFSLCHDMTKCPLNMESPKGKIEAREARTERGGERAASYKGVVINGNDGRREQNNEGRAYQGKGKGKMVEDDETNWVRVSGRDTRRPSADGSRFKGEEIDSRYRRPRHELNRNSIQDGRYRSSGFRGVRRERSPRENFLNQERSKGRTYEGTMRSSQPLEPVVTNREASQQREGDVILAPVKGLGADQVCMRNEVVENGLDVINEVMLEQETLVKTDDMDTDENDPSLKEGVVTIEGEEEFQDVTDEEADGNQALVQGDSAASVEIGEEGELEKIENTVGGGEEQRTKKEVVQRSSTCGWHFQDEDGAFSNLTAQTHSEQVDFQAGRGYEAWRGNKAWCGAGYFKP